MTLHTPLFNDASATATQMLKSAYELAREARIARNRAMMQQLGKQTKVLAHARVTTYNALSHFFYLITHALCS